VLGELIMPVTEIISQSMLDSRIKELATQVNRDYHGKSVVLVGVLKGSFVFLADLARALWQAGLHDCEIDFIGLSSYGDDTESSKNPHITMDLGTDIRKRHVLIVEDIIDTGYSLEVLHRILSAREPASLNTLVLLSKSKRRQVDIKLGYIGFRVEGWVEGYGLDSSELNRGRPNVVKISSVESIEEI
jgi:hypoxanthine phosphoribosyltransferase